MRCLHTAAVVGSHSSYKTAHSPLCAPHAFSKEKVLPSKRMATMKAKANLCLILYHTLLCRIQGASSRTLPNRNGFLHIKTKQQFHGHHYMNSDIGVLWQAGVRPPHTLVCACSDVCSVWHCVNLSDAAISDVWGGDAALG